MLIAENISLNYVDQVLFEDISLAFSGRDKKRIAIVGKNGCGKSSLLKIFNQELKPTTGKVTLYDEKIGFIKQEVDFAGHELVGEYLESGLTNEWEGYKIDIALEKIGLNQDYLIKSTATLSGGEKIKIALAYILLKEPTMLFLDEPTNNLDQAGIEWLEGFIRDFNGSIVVVSHDRYMINRVIKEIWELSTEEGIVSYTGNYEDFLVARKERFDKKMHDYLMSKRRIDKLENWIKINQKLIPFSTVLAQRKKALERVKKTAVDRPDEDPRVRLRNLGGADEGRMLIVDVEEKRFGERVLLKNTYFKVYNEDRILVAGPNGSGKTTLLNIIAGIDKDYSGTIGGGDKVKIGYMRQFSDLDATRNVLDEFEEKTGITGAIARSILANYLFSNERIDDRVKNLSYGELRRMDLAIILAKKPNVLILDEPTNHLDIFTREELENFILSQEIPMIIVSHDQYFVQKIGVNKILRLGK
ncbi:MAG TPA: ABC-F family ATP-binding cassette domain-containing protein [Patescibacteria group bacterium]|nr:ABC-F family ATP-binding cassette domain-containing protein [Patescibacteria group bacterium]